MANTKYIKKMTKEQAKAYGEAWSEPIDEETKALIKKRKKERAERAKAQNKKR